jgi:O-antigen ligase
MSMTDALSGRGEAHPLSAGGRRRRRDRLGAWCGGCLAFALALSPLVAWLGPLGFAPLAGVVGALCLPALVVTEEDRPGYLAVLVTLIWAAGSTIWSPYRHEPWGAAAIKLVAEAGFYFSVVCAARRASPASRTLCLRILAWGTAALGLVMLVEALAGGALYLSLRDLMSAPIRPDLGRKNIAQALFVLALFWPAATVAAMRTTAGWWLAAPMLAGLVAGSLLLGYDAPIIALVASLAAGLAVWRWPLWAPRALGAVAAAYFLLMPALMWTLKVTGAFEALKADVPLSWSQRLGYWGHASGWIADHPLRGWGLDASRMFSPGIQLHPHDAALQIWLELGLIGATAAAVFWAALFVRMSRPQRDLAVVAGAASGVAYLVFAAVSFGVWQEWWLALGGLTAACAAAVVRQPAPAPKAGESPAAQKSSTFAAISE